MWRNVELRRERELKLVHGCAHPLHQSEGEIYKEREREEAGREKEGGRKRERCRIFVIFIFKRNHGCLGTL